MAGRPEILFPLFASVETLPGIGKKMAQALEALAIQRPRDLLFHLPHSVVDRRPVASVQGQALPATLTVPVTARNHVPPRRPGGPYRIYVKDAETVFQIIYFRARGPYLESLFPQGEERIVSGKIELFDGEAQMVHPDYVVAPEAAAEIAEFEALYPLAAGITQKALSKAMLAALERLPELPEWADPVCGAQECCPAFGYAVECAHAPR